MRCENLNSKPTRKTTNPQAGQFDRCFLTKKQKNIKHIFRCLDTGVVSQRRNKKTLKINTKRTPLCPIFKVLVVFSETKNWIPYFCKNLTDNIMSFLEQVLLLFPSSIRLLELKMMHWCYPNKKSDPNFLQNMGKIQ